MCNRRPFLWLGTLATQLIRRFSLSKFDVWWDPVRFQRAATRFLRTAPNQTPTVSTGTQYDFICLWFVETQKGLLIPTEASFKCVGAVLLFYALRNSQFLRES